MKRFLAVPLMALMLSGCAARAVHPGAANAFDSSAFDTLDITHGVIENTKTDIAAGAFDASLVPNIKAALNDLIVAYNVADSAYLVYHVAALSGTATVAQTNALTAGLQQVNTATTTLVSIKGNH